MDADDIIKAGRAIRGIATALGMRRPDYADLDDIEAEVEELVDKCDALEKRVAELEQEAADLRSAAG